MYITTDKCTLIKACVEACPTNSIKIINDKAFSCVTCGKCMDVCPVDAIFKNRYGGYIVDKEKCIGCSICEKNCPVSVIKMVKYKDKRVPQGICAMCNVCRDVCPTGARVNVEGKLRFNLESMTIEEVKK
ncbi:MAG: 4Fe-4S binding protein [Methanofastidiosum sp.]|jgi:energy-converting hydrogenase B subunit K|nr:4Fe-4S binding protein [Methanofastidiosum sp.]